MELAINKPKRSIKLKPSELKRLKAFMKDKTWFEASFALQVERGTLSRVIGCGSGAQKTIDLIRQNLPQ